MVDVHLGKLGRIVDIAPKPIKCLGAGSVWRDSGFPAMPECFGTKDGAKKLKRVFVVRSVKELDKMGHVRRWLAHLKGEPHAGFATRHRERGIATEDECFCFNHANKIAWVRQLSNI